MRQLNIRDSYSLYKKTTVKEKLVDIKIYMDIVLGFIKFMMKKLIEGKDIKMFSELGILGIRGRKQVPRLDKDGNIIGLPPDWQATMKLWNENPEAKMEKRLVYHFNEHSSGVRYKIVWFKKNFKFKHKRLYSIQFSRNNRRTLSALIKGGKEYTEGKYSRKNQNNV